MLQVGEGFYNQARLIDDLIARTEEDIRQQRATIEDKQERKRKYKEICEAIYIAVENLNQQSVAIRKSLTSDCEQSTGYDNHQSSNVVNADKGREGTMRHDNAVMIANNDALILQRHHNSKILYLFRAIALTPLICYLNLSVAVSNLRLPYNTSI